MKRFTVILGVVAFGLLSGVALAACGGGSTPETPIVLTGTTPQNLTKAEFIAQADSICNTADTQISTIAASGGGVTQAAQVAQLRSSEVSDIRNLGTPAGSSSTSLPPTGTSAGPTTSSGITTPDTSTFPSGTTSTSSSGSTGTTGSSTGSTSTGSSATSGDPLATFLSELEAQVKAGEKIDLANQRHQSTTSAEAELQSAKNKAAAAATQYGFLKCGTQGTASTSTSTGATGGTVTPSAPSTSAPVTPSAPSTGGGTGGGGGSSGGSGGSGGVGPG